MWNALTLATVAIVLAGSSALANDIDRAPGQKPRCGGEEATIVGTAGPDVIVATDGSDVIGEDGNDHLDGGRGHDALAGGAGRDVCKRGEDVSTCEAP